MKVFLSGLALAATALLATAGPVVSGDWNNGGGGIKDYRGGGVPVPAPAPTAEYRSNWYLRGDVGIGFADDPTVKESGLRFGINDAPGSSGPEPFGLLPAWLSKDFDTSFTGGIGVGYYISKHLRTDVTLDVLGANSVTARGNFRYLAHQFRGNPLAWVPIDQVRGTTVFGTVVDKTELNSSALLFNFYADLFNRGPFTPYIGGGLGVAYTKAERNHQTTEFICDVNVDPLCLSRVARPGLSRIDNSHSVGLAAAAMAGIVYEISESTKLDFNYRYLYLADSKASLAFGSTNGIRSELEIGDQHQHQIRAGIRFDIN